MFIGLVVKDLNESWGFFMSNISDAELHCRMFNGLKL
jgi:hypothetical protein